MEKFTFANEEKIEHKMRNIQTRQKVREDQGPKRWADKMVGGGRVFRSWRSFVATTQEEAATTDATIDPDYLSFQVWIINKEKISPLFY